MSSFESITSVGGLLPSDLLSRVASSESSLPGAAPEEYGLVPGERLNDAITRSWNRLDGIWKSFLPELEALPKSERTATSLTRERWLRPLLDELGFAGLPTAPTATIEGKDYAISHQWAGTVPVHLPGARIAVDRRTPGVPGAAQTSPHGLVQEFLNRSDDNLWGMVSNGLTLRLLRDNASLTRQAYVEFDLAAMFTGERFSDFVVLWLTCHRTRFEGDPPEKCFLEQWTQEAASAGTRALDKLRDGVEQAIVSLGEGFITHAANGPLRQKLRTGDLPSDEYQRQLLRVVYRLLFLLVAESRDLLLAPDADATVKERYRQFYSVERLRQLATKRRGTKHDDLWDGHQLVVSALEHDGAPALGLAPFGSFLWSQAATADLNGCRLDNGRLLDTIRALTRVRDDESRVDRAVDYRNLGAEELGSIYESLLELHADVDPDARTLTLGTAAGNERKTTGSYYTPSSLINELLSSALDPVLDEAARKPDAEAAILSLNIIDPAVGSGHFLIAAANRTAQRLAAVRAGGIEPAPDEVRAALRDVVSTCVHGIDVNPMAVELCKVSLWLEAMEPGKPLSFLDHRIVCGNALLGTTPRLLAAGIPDGAYKPLGRDDRTVATSLRKRNREERHGQQTLGFESHLAGPIKRMTHAIEKIDSLAADDLETVDRKQQLYIELQKSTDATRAHLAADAWCAAFVSPKTSGAPEITTDTVRRLNQDPSSVPTSIIDQVRDIKAQHGFIHLHLAFPDVLRVPESLELAENSRAGWNGGFDVILGNPPWDQIQYEPSEVFLEYEDVALARTTAIRDRLIDQLIADSPSLKTRHEDELRSVKATQHLIHASALYPLTSVGRLNTAPLFAESMERALSQKGRLGLVLPTGIATDSFTQAFFRYLIESRRLRSLFDFINNRGLFPGVGHGRQKFSLVTVAGSDGPDDLTFEFVFFAEEPADVADPERRIPLRPQDFAALNPNTMTSPVFATRSAYDVCRRLYDSAPVFRLDSGERDSGWDLQIKLMVATNTSAALLQDGKAVTGMTPAGNVRAARTKTYWPLFEAKMIHQYTCRWGDYSLRRPESRDSELPRPSLGQLKDPSYVVQPRHWIASDELHETRAEVQPEMGLRNIARSTDERTIIASLLPRAAFFVTKITLIRVDPELSNMRLCLLGNLNSLPFDFAARQKVGGTDIALHVLKQLPVLPSESFRAATPWSDGTLYEWIVPRVVELSYTSWDLGKVETAVDVYATPYRWIEERRVHLRAELDACFFHLYGLELAEVDYVLDTFPIVRRKDEERHGEFRTKRLVLGCYDRMAEAKMSGKPYETMLDPPPADPSLCHPESTRPDWADLYLEL